MRPIVRLLYFHANSRERLISSSVPTSGLDLKVRKLYEMGSKQPSSHRIYIFLVPSDDTAFWESFNYHLLLRIVSFSFPISVPDTDSLRLLTSGVALQVTGCAFPLFSLTSRPPYAKETYHVFASSHRWSLSKILSLSILPKLLSEELSRAKV